MSTSITPAPGEHPQKPDLEGIPQAPRPRGPHTCHGLGVGHLEADQHGRRHEGAAALAPVAVDDNPHIPLDAVHQPRY